jgi:outer membrane protein OmpA-like peptidoglycan-associated protein
MKKQLFLSSLLLILFGFSVSAQELVDINNTSICEKALDISRFQRFGPTTAPVALGTEKPNSFQHTPHPTWYKFTVNKDGILLFDILPNNPKDNYDFMLFKDEPDFCKKFAEGKIAALRENKDGRIDSLSGATGLSFNGQQQGYLKGIDVKTNETYYLALNNVYDKGSGHTIVFKNLITYTISGNVLNQKNDHTLTANVTLRNINSPEISTSTETDKKGSFSLKIGLSNENSANAQYELCAYADKFFPLIKLFTAEEIKNLCSKPYDLQLTKLKKSYNEDELKPIYFEPNDMEIVPESQISLNKLLRLMSLNTKIEILLEGHTNGIYPSTAVDMQLSESRSNAVKTYLTTNNIDPTRIQIKGFGSTKEMYEMPETEEQEGFNRRVEINILKF